MTKICYVPKTFRSETLYLIGQANRIVAEYQAAGFDLTLRQLFYQFVSRDWLPNKSTEYDRLGAIIADARMAGLLDWEIIVDRTRNLASQSHWPDPQSILRSAANGFQLDKWEDQPSRIEVWVEKEALSGVVDRACRPLDVPYLACRGYMSLSEMWSASIRLKRYGRDGQLTTILHMGDHDPSGIDMSRDIADRLVVFGDEETRVKRIALTMDQIDQYNPPPNPAKMTDSRATGYVDRYGDQSWELDALDPQVLVDLITEEIEVLRDDIRYEDAETAEERQREVLTAIADRWEDVQAYIGENG